MAKHPSYIRWFGELSLSDLALVGGKAASLGEMFQRLTPLGLRIPDGFAVTTQAYRDALEAARAWPELHRLLDKLDKSDVDALARVGLRAREIVYAAAMPVEAEQALREAWRRLKTSKGEDLSVAVRSSATAEDLPGASFAGQHDTYLNVRSEQLLVDAVKRCQASLFTDRAISYRIDKGFDHFKVSLSVAVMQMVRSDLASAGVMFTIDTESGHPDMVFITVMQLAEAAITIEDHYSQIAGQRRAMDIEWAKDGPDGQIFIVQARPETGVSQRNPMLLEEYLLDGVGSVRATGRAVGSKIAAGRVRQVANAQHLASFLPGEVLVADTTAPDWEPVMKTACAIVTNRGGRTCHAAIVARELGIPAVVGTENASDVLRDGDSVTVCCAQGALGRVYDGQLGFHKQVSDLSGIQRPATEIMINLGNPELAFQLSQLPCDGVGLARMEFIINEHIQVHPMAVLHPERIQDAAVRARVVALSHAYPSGADYFVERLAEGVGTIAAAFYPRPVIVRLSDFKSNEYAALLGGRDFEQHEENPMIGFRGAARYIHPAYAEAFALECAAMKRVREVMGLNNLKLMLPFCRRIDEARRVLASMAAHGLTRGEKGLEVYVMCEIPNNVLLIDEFSELFDGFSIGSNDLTQLTLGVDRDSAIVADSFDEQDPGMRKMLRLAVEGARRNHRHVGICGQAPSDHIEVARYLVELGIDSISLTPDRVLQTMQAVQKIEAALGRKGRA